MAVQSAYAQALTTQSAVGQNRYAVKLKNLTAGGAWARVKVKASPGGPCTWQSMHIRQHGGGNFDFIGQGVPVLFGGSSAVTRAANQEQWSDPFQLTTVAGESLVARFDINGVSGQHYFYGAVSETEALAGHNSGLIGAANGDPNAAAYYVYSGNGGHYAHSIVAIEVADALEDFAPVVPEPAESPTASMLPAYWFNAIRSDQMFSSGRNLPGVAGQMLTVGLYNPADSGVEVWLWQVTVNADADTVLSIHSSPMNTWPIVPSRCNLDFRNVGGAPPAPGSLAKVRSPAAGSIQTPPVANAGITTVPDGKHAYEKLRGNMREAINLTPYPLIRIGPGYGGYALVLHTLGIGATVDFHWQEIPI